MKFGGMIVGYNGLDENIILKHNMTDEIVYFATKRLRANIEYTKMRHKWTITV